MAKLGSGVKAQSASECPIAVYLTNKKGNLAVWNKEKGQDDIHKLNKFIILTVTFGIKGQVWNDSIQKYTNTYFSNEIADFSETIYAVDITFNPTTKTLVAKGNWKTEVKPHMPQGIGIKALLTVLDLNDGLVKQFVISPTEYFGGLNEIITSNDPDTIYSYEIKKMYTSGKKDKAGNEVLITEAELDKLPRVELVKMKNRYKSELKNIGKAKQDEIEAAEENMNAILEYNEERNSGYKNKYGEVEKENYGTPDQVDQEEENFKATEEQKTVAKEKIESNDEISVEDIPF